MNGNIDISQWFSRSPMDDRAGRYKVLSIYDRGQLDCRPTACQECGDFIPHKDGAYKMSGKHLMNPQ